VCRALKVLCAAPDGDALGQLKRAAVSAHWELVGGAASLDELASQLEGQRPDVLVLDTRLGPDAERRAVALLPSLRVVTVEPAPDQLHMLRTVILGLPGPGGPVRR
jgi:hypothetical protein